MRQEKKLIDVVRAAVKNSGLSQNAIAKRCGFSHRIIGRFLNGRDIRLESASDILAALHIRVELKPIDKE